MTDWDKLMDPARNALEALIAKGDEMADRIEELEERLKAAQDDAKEAEAYANELEAKLAKADALAIAIERRMVDLGGFDNRFGLRKALEDYYRIELTGGKDE